MKFCSKCGNELVDGASFCNACGNPAEVYEAKPKTAEQLKQEEQECLNNFNLALKHERLCWKIYGIFYLICSIIIIAASLIMGIGAIGLAYVEPEATAALIVMATAYFIMGAVYLAIAIINITMKNKLDSYRGRLYTDCTDGIGHYSVGSIVFAAFFNNVALVFIIINFIKAKNRKAVIERIKKAQEAYNTQQY